jgi:hypothetical protein
VLVGCLLAGVAVYLIQRNRSFLIGRSMVKDDFQKIVRHLKRDPVIKNIYEAKSEEIGEGIFRCWRRAFCYTMLNLYISALLWTALSAHFDPDSWTTTFCVANTKLTHMTHMKHGIVVQV